MYDFIASVRPIKTQEQLDAVLAAAKEDDHTCLSPTHYITKGGKIVGHVSIGIGPWPLVMSHFSKLHFDVEDTAIVLNAIETILENSKATLGYFTMVPQSSPNYVTINHPKTGFKNLGEGNLFVKEF